MIDVVFLLLVFFMLVARFGHDGSIALSAAVGNTPYEGPPRLVEIRPSGLSLNGQALGERDFLEGLSRLTATPGDAIILRPVDGATLQDLVETMELLDQAGYSNLPVVE